MARKTELTQDLVNETDDELHSKGVKPKTVLELILEWSLQRPNWQRDALRRIIVNGQLNESDYTELVKLCKQEKSEIETELKAIPLDKIHLPANPGIDDSVSLSVINDVVGVNNLASSQALYFEENGLTIIYGDNGAGKSGYGRILKKACTARHSVEIQPNIYDGLSLSQPPSANFTFTIGGVEQPLENWVDTNYPHPTLSAISVFDSDCASVHINGKNVVAFRPFGLDVPDELAGACQRVKDILVSEQKQLEKSRNPIFSKPVWKDKTVVGSVLSSLKNNTDVESISALATFSDDELVRLNRLREDLSKNPAKAAAEQKLKADNIKGLLNAVTCIAQNTTDESLAQVFDFVRDAQSKRKAAQLAADMAFSSFPLTGIGGDVWKSLWESARRYSTEVAYPNKPYPPSQEDALCVLCQQPLDTEALNRLALFDEFIKKDTERLAQESENISKEALDNIISQNMALHPLKPCRQEVAIQNPELTKQTLRFIASARLRRYALIKSLDSTDDLQLPNTTDNPTSNLEQLERTVRNYALELEKSSIGEEKKKLEDDFAELADREILSNILPTILEEIERLQAIHFIVQCLKDTTTNAITKIGNDIADIVITPKLRDRFQEEIIKLAAEKVKVEIVRTGGKFGSPQYQIRLSAKPDAKVGSILSEGEQTCVALAAFLTELAIATHHSTLVFDDPVSSLDHRRRKQVAKRLVDEIENRQIIVFTHDLVFVNDLIDLAKCNSQPFLLKTISRGRQGAGIVSDGLPWIAKSVEDRIDKLEKSTRMAEKSYDDNQDDAYREQVAKIYNNLRASWEHALEDIAFFRVIQRHRDYIETRNLKKVSVLSDTDCDDFHAGFKNCCNIVDAHDPSRARNAEAPPPNEVFQDIQALKDWAIDLRGRQKKIN
ncbi:DNA repair protein [Methylococcaceae bacterium CS2]|nr:DNA repair protein [Methylococcaceae bacterium CS2]